MKQTDKIINQRDQEIVDYMNAHLDDVERLLRTNYDFYRKERLMKVWRWVQTVGVVVLPIVILIVLAMVLYEIVR